MAFYYYEETTVYRRKPEPEEPDNGPVSMAFVCLFWIFIIAAIAKGCS